MFLYSSDILPGKKGYLGQHHNRRFSFLRLHSRSDHPLEEQARAQDQPGQWLYITTNRLRQHRQPCRNQPKDHCLLRIRNSIPSRLGLLTTYPRRKQRIRYIHQYTAWEEPFL